MAKMKFAKDMFYTSRDVPLYTAGRVYEVAEEMVDRWLKRGGELVPDSTAKHIDKQLDASLAANLEADGKGTHRETLDAVEAMHEDDDFEDVEEDFEEEDSHGKKTTAKKKVMKKKTKSRS